MKYHLEDSIAGHNGLIDYNSENNRITYLIDYESAQIVPTLHRNTISLFGMKKRENYITFRKVMDKFIALDK